MKINAPADYDLRHFRFERTAGESPVVEVYAPRDGLRWAVAVAVAAVALLALAVTG